MLVHAHTIDSCRAAQWMGTHMQQSQHGPEYGQMEMSSKSTRNMQIFPTKWSLSSLCPTDLPESSNVKVKTWCHYQLAVTGDHSNRAAICLIRRNIVPQTITLHAPCSKPAQA